jgi:hypothetical protein
VILDRKSLRFAVRKASFPTVIAVSLLVCLLGGPRVTLGQPTNNLLVVVRGTEKAGSESNAVGVVVHEAEKGPKLKAVVEILVGIATLLTLIYGVYTAIRKFGWSREECTFLRMELHAKVIREVGELLLVTVTIRLENKGQTRLSARKLENLPYNDGFDACDFPGTLKVRGFPDQNRIKVFNWYDLKPLPGIEDMLEQINYLDEFQDPSNEFEGSDFWLEPNETAESQVPLWLAPGSYAFKAFFLGKETEPNEEEYWSVTRFFYLEKLDESQTSKK